LPLFSRRFSFRFLAAGFLVPLPPLFLVPMGASRWAAGVAADLIIARSHHYSTDSALKRGSPALV
jgi:hypothetical protein